MASSQTPVRRRRIFGLGVGQVLVLLIALVVAAAGGYFGYQRLFVPETAAAARVQTQPVRRGNLAATVNSTGTVQAVNTARLAFRGGGTLAEVLVKVGDPVTAGQPLARLDTKELEISLRQAQANLSSAQARLAQTLAGATESEIQSAVAAVASAQAQLVRARNDYEKLVAGPTPAEIQQAAAALEKARNALQSAQSDYDRIAWRGDAGATPQAVALANATADYQTALANYNAKIAPPNPNDLEAARQAVASAERNVESANARLAQLRAGPLPSDVAAARAAVETAAAQVASAQLNLERATLTAPFNGVVQAVTASPGEVVSGAFITLVDPNTLRLDVNVDENDVARVELNQVATVTLDALPGRTFRGRVVAIAPTATVAQGVASYLVSVAIDQPQGIKPGMTASVQIVVEERANVLLAPARAVRTQGRQRFVEVLTPSGQIETRAVTIGLSNDQQVEITNGVREGELLVLATTTTRPGVTTGPGGVPGFPGVPIPR
ncbi:MAG: efflux RND transporter periplasmic adaptor subunit [Chloroflexota bacterium]|nr:efflux RND transporter periplasmic adaptor subunit [Dehalococcoidia bacterium]MDW8253783.1 efflux RND transporter periplasmic adaptor subunit [Chloroflexota bacterium]